MGVFLFLISFSVAIFLWIFVARKFKAAGRSGISSHFAGAAVGFLAWVVVILLGVSLEKPKTNDGGQIVAASEPQAGQPAAANTDAPVATLDLDWDTFRQRVDEDFAAAGFGFAKIPNTLKPEGEQGAARLTVMLPINDNLVATIAEDPASKQLTGISVTVGPHEDTAENIKNFSAAALMLSAAGGDDGNKKVGGKIIEMATNAINKFAQESAKNNADKVEDSFVENGVKYGILVSKFTPVMMFAQPNKITK